MTDRNYHRYTGNHSYTGVSEHVSSKDQLDANDAARISSAKYNTAIVALLDKMKLDKMRRARS